MKSSIDLPRTLVRGYMEQSYIMFKILKIFIFFNLKNFQNFILLIISF